MKVTIAVCLPHDVGTIGIVRGIAGRTLAAFDVDPECVRDVVLALSEACTNVVEHSTSDDEYEITLTFDEHECELTVVDTGHQFNGSSVSPLMPDADAARGRGLAIMRAVMDDFQLECELGAGTIVRCRKHLAATPDGQLARLRDTTPIDPGLSPP